MRKLTEIYVVKSFGYLVSKSPMRFWLNDMFRAQKYILPNDEVNTGSCCHRSSDLTDHFVSFRISHRSEARNYMKRGVITEPSHIVAVIMVYYQGLLF